MKDAYSFDLDDEGLDASYDAMFRAYERIFVRCGIPTVPVEADSGAIGGKARRSSCSSPMSARTPSSPATIATMPPTRRRPRFVRPPAEPEEPLPLEEVETPGVTTIEALAEFLDVPPSRTAKAVFYTCCAVRTRRAAASRSSPSSAATCR